MTIEETHKDGVDSTVLTLSTGSHEQDVKAMLELYDDLIERYEPQNDQENSEATKKLPKVPPKRQRKLRNYPDNYSE